MNLTALSSPSTLVAIDRNGWSRWIGMPEGSNRSHVTSIAASSAGDRFEAGLNEAACCWGEGLWEFELSVGR